MNSEAIPILGGSIFLLILDRQGSDYPVGSPRFAFRHFNKEEALIQFAVQATTAAGDRQKIHKIACMTNNGKTTEHTISFSEGRFVLEVLPEKEPTLREASTKELHQELEMREGIEGFTVTPDGSFQIPIYGGEQTILGPCRVLVNHD